MYTVGSKTNIRRSIEIDFNFDSNIEMYFYIKKHYPNLNDNKIFNIKAKHESKDEDLILATNLIAIKSACWEEIEDALFTGDNKRKLYLAALKYDAEYKDKNFVEKVLKHLELMPI